MSGNKTVKYWVAGHITSFFFIADQSHDILQKGSRGAGINLDQGVFTEVAHSSQIKQKYFLTVSNKNLVMR